jgi:uncharacterized protein
MNNFYREGLNFSCKRCSRCCRYEEGFVFLSSQDLIKLMKCFNMTAKTFIKKYCRRVTLGGVGRISLKEKQNKDCVFWHDGRCGVYANRPLQCRSYPFWAHNLINRETWDSLEKECPGVNSGIIHSENEINSWLRKRGEEPFLDPDLLSRLFK